jgi:hypothetical protein
MQVCITGKEPAAGYRGAAAREPAGAGAGAVPGRLQHQDFDHTLSGFVFVVSVICAIVTWILAGLQTAANFAQIASLIVGGAGIIATRERVAARGTTAKARSR